MSEHLLTVSPSPHIHAEQTVPQIMRGVIIAMVPAFLFAVYNFGLGALYVTTLSVLFCIGSEYLIVKYLFRKPATLTDGSAIITGMLLAFNLPSNLPWYMILIGSIVAMVLGKWSYGGLGNNPFNPALVGRVFLLLSFPVAMTRWPVAQATWSLDGTTGATPLGIVKEGLRAGETMPDLMKQIPSYTDFLVGSYGGSLGEMSAVALLLGFVYLLYKRIITWHTTVAMLAAVFVLSGIFWLIDPNRYASPLFHLLSGGVLLGAVFMATDYVTSPVTHRGMLLYGAMIGVLTVMIRLFGGYPEGVSFAILIMNGFVPMINQYLKPPRYGARGANKKTEKESTAVLAK